MIYFIRRPSMVAGIGLITITSAILLDTILGAFDRDLIISQLGFFFYIISGLLIAGAAIWVAGVTRPFWGGQVLIQNALTETKTAPIVTRPPVELVDELNDTPIDRQMLYDEMRTRLGFDDLLDLMYDLELYENDHMTFPQNVKDLIVSIMDYCQERGMNHQLALSVERIITPPPPDHMPRLGKITIESPPTIVRHFLLANYSFADLQRIANVLDVDWEQLDRTNKKAFVRNLLRHLERRNGIPRLIQTMHDIVNPTILAEQQQS
ncbi:MAG: hypothetical protein AAF490_08370 [Chloroflexota bacterium]